MCYMYLLFIIVSITFFGLITSFDYDYDKMGGGPTGDYAVAFSDLL
jgi:hypothetical protein